MQISATTFTYASAVVPAEERIQPIGWAGALSIPLDHRPRDHTHTDTHNTPDCFHCQEGTYIPHSGRHSCWIRIGLQMMKALNHPYNNYTFEVPLWSSHSRFWVATIAHKPVRRTFSWTGHVQLIRRCRLVIWLINIVSSSQKYFSLFFLLCQARLILSESSPVHPKYFSICFEGLIVWQVVLCRNPICT